MDCNEGLYWRYALNKYYKVTLRRIPPSQFSANLLNHSFIHESTSCWFVEVGVPCPFKEVQMIVCLPKKVEDGRRMLACKTDRETRNVIRRKHSLLLQHGTRMTSFKMQYPCEDTTHEPFRHIAPNAHFEQDDQYTLIEITSASFRLFNEHGMSYYIKHRLVTLTLHQ